MYDFEIICDNNSSTTFIIINNYTKLISFSVFKNKSYRLKMQSRALQVLVSNN